MMRAMIATSIYQKEAASMDMRRRLGNAGEQIAETMLKKKGYKILKRQYQIRFGEIDLIALDGDEVVFIEVKTRHASEGPFPEESVGEKKLRRMEITAEHFLKAQAFESRDYRFDVIAITLTAGEPEIVHLVGV